MCRNRNHWWFIKVGAPCDCAITTRINERGVRVDCTVAELQK